MKIGILESGTVARTVGGRLAELGHEIMFGTRDMARTLARKDPDAFAHPPFKDWQA